MAHPGHALTCAKLRRRRIRAGLCPQCGRNPAGAGRQCGECNERARRRGRARYLECKAGMTCYFCGGIKRAGKSRCYECLEIHYEREKSRREGRA